MARHGSLSPTPSERRRVCIVTATRADYSKLAPVMKGVDADPDLELQLVVMGSHLLDDAGHTLRMVLQDGFRPDMRLHTIVGGDDPAAMVESVGVGLLKIPDVFQRLRPHIVVVHGDRFDAMAVALTSSFMNITTFHIEGGEVSGTIDDSIRHAITKLAHYHIVSTERARERILGMCEMPERVLCAGCPAYDRMLGLPVDTSVPSRYNVEPGRFCIALYHPVTTDLEESIPEYGRLLDALIELNRPTMLFWPNIDAGSKELVRAVRMRNIEKAGSNIMPYKSLPFAEFTALMAQAALMVGNSSAGIREAGAFGVPVVNVGTRQTDRECGPNVVHVIKGSKDELLRAMKSQWGKSYDRVTIYGDGKAVGRIVRLMKSVDVTLTHKHFNFSALFDKVTDATSSKAQGDSAAAPSPAKPAADSALPSSPAPAPPVGPLSTALAVDLGGSNLRVALVDHSGNILLLRTAPSPKTGRDDILSAMVKLLREVRQSAAADSAVDPVGVGISTGGRVDFEHGVVTDSTSLIPDWNGVNLRTHVGEALGLPVWVDNDGNCAAHAERVYGAGSSVPNFIAIIVGTGIGGGVYVGGELLRGARNAAAELGHVSVSFEGRACTCGSVGCVEAYASGSALASRATELLQQGKLAPPPRGMPADGKYLASLAKTGDATALEVLSHAGTALGTAIVGLLNIFNPSLVILSGPLVQLGDPYLSSINWVIKDRALSVARDSVGCVRSKLVEPALLGAAALVFRYASKQ